ncbi:MAG: formate dehydrogenase accessory protein FdhE [Desulfobacterales bacterium]|nr:formate dehydrogenase accessory protein FdhE [Desulfobacterales bacterium]
MNEKQNMSDDQIKKAVAAIKAERPAYEKLLDFFEKLFLAQEETKGHLDLEPIEIPKDLLSVKRQEKFPLVNRADFAIDTKASGALLKKICRLSAEATEVLAEACSKISNALEKGALEPTTLFSKLLMEDDAYFQEVSQGLEIDKKVLTFVAYTSIMPALSLCAEQLTACLDKDTPWQKGYCPICGSPPALSILRDEGQRSLLCSFCGHEWQALRIYCPFCDNKDRKTLHYFFSEEEEEGYRVDMCDQCKRYIKTVDTRKMSHPVHPLVEHISTLHLDILAQEQGLESGIPSWLQT